MLEVVKILEFDMSLMDLNTLVRETWQRSIDSCVFWLQLVWGIVLAKCKIGFGFSHSLW